MVEPGTHPDPDEPQELIHDDAEPLSSEEVAGAVETVGDALEEGPASPKAITKILAAIGPVASKAWGGTTAVASQVGGLARAYPRASIASGLSALVLCGVFSLQSGKAPPTNNIKNPEATGAEANAEASPKGTETKPKEESGTTPPPAAESVAEDPAPAPAPVDATPAPAALEPTPEPAEVKLAGGDAALPDLPSMIDSKASEAVAPAPAPAPTPEPPVEPGASLLLASAKPIEEPPAPAPEPTLAAEPEIPPAVPAPAPAPGPEPTPTTEPELPPAVPAPAAAPAPEAVDSEKAPAPTLPSGPEPEAPAPAPAVEPEPQAPAPTAEAPPTTPKSDAPASQPALPPDAPAEPAFTPPAEPVQPSAPPAAFPALGAITGTAAAEAAPGPNMTTQEPTAPSPASQPTEEPKGDWLPLKHNGGPVKLDPEEMDSRGGIDPVTGESSDPLRDARRAANEEPIRFVPVEPRPAAAVGVAAGAAGATAAVTSRTSSRAAAASDAGKMDTVLHKVQAGENFWTISRTHYASGRYYRALGKANADQFQRLEDLYVGAVIRIPPPEDLDPAYIDPPGGRSSRNRDPAETAAAPTAKAPRTAAAGTPVRRGKLEGELNLPVSDPSTERTADTGERRRASSRDDYDAEEPAATSRRAASPPVHKVRARETLRTIARDRLGDSRRAREILDLNRDVIDDPARLPVGQVLNLPDDAE